MSLISYPELKFSFYSLWNSKKRETFADYSYTSPAENSINHQSASTRAESKEDSESKPILSRQRRNFMTSAQLRKVRSTDDPVKQLPPFRVTKKFDSDSDKLTNENWNLSNPISFKLANSNNESGATSPTKTKGLKSLKSIIKSSNARFIEHMESDYLESGPKTSEKAIFLARIYLDGKRVPQNIPRAIEILSKSSLRESKYILMKLAVDFERYTEAYYYAEMLSLATWTCVQKEVRGKTKSKVIKPRKLSEVTTSPSKCIKHLTDALTKQVMSSVGESQCKLFKKAVASTGFSPCWDL